MQVGDTVYGSSSLPFGWAHSPAQEPLGMYLSVTHPDQVVLVHYLDDVLLLSTDRGVLRTDTVDLAATLETGGWVVSRKSELEPAKRIHWMGKSINGVNHTICSDTGYLAALMTSWISLCTTGYTQHGLHRMLGRILRASRPSNTAMPFVAGAFA